MNQITQAKPHYLVLILVIFLVFSQALPVFAATPPPIKFIWVGAIDRQFTEAEFQKIASTYGIMVFEAIHANAADNNFESYHQAARRLVAINPDIKVFPYFNASSIRAGFDTAYINAGFRDEWYLRDLSGNKVIYHHKGLVHYVDLSNPQYRAWALNMLSSWLNKAPYSGIAFDSVNSLDELESSNPRKLNAIGQTKIDAWNDGLKSLIRDAKSRFAGKTIIANGIANRLPDKNASNLVSADMILNESFCVGLHEIVLKPKEELIAGIATGRSFATTGKIVLQKTNFGEAINLGTPAQRSHAGRFCYGLFLLSYIPDKAYYKFGIGYGVNDDKNVSEIEYVAPELDIPLGTPTGPIYQRTGDLWSRKFTNGIVYLNMGTTNLTVNLPFNVTLINGNIPSTTYTAGQTVTIPKQDVKFFVKQLPTLPADLTDQGDTSGDQVNQYDANQL
ncbi:hypothetical protein COT87_02675, partial [Candidatus Collierbacteria bacterium CG10_big_fil_rev_8_21_14_0_10_44_9]